MQMIVSQRGYAAAPGCPCQEPKLHQIRLINIFQGDRFLTDGGSQCLQTHRAAAVVADDGTEHPAVNIVQAQRIHFQPGQRQIRCFPGDNAVAHDLCKVPDTAQEPVGNSGRTPAAGGDLHSAHGVDLHPQNGCGTGNDFAHDLGYSKECNPFPITEHLKNLPSVTVKGKTWCFINGVGYGIDGYCCEVGDKLKEIPGKRVNYTAIAINGLLFPYKPTNAKVTVDGTATTYKKVWIAPTMNGRFYGGGMMPTPNQVRNSGKVSTMIFYNSGKLKTLMMFPSLFKGEHVKYKNNVDILTGKEVTVEFDRPVSLQIDGETILGVSSYTVKTPAVVSEKERAAAAAAN